MALTRKLLKDMQLEEAHIEEIIAAHASTVEGLKAERDAIAAQLDGLQAQASQTAEVQAAFDAYRLQVEEDQQRTQAASLARLALIQAGCNEKVVDLLLRDVDPAALSLEDGCLKNEAELIHELKGKYAAFFAQPVRLAAPAIHPPVPTGGALTREDLSRMSADEINRNWNAVKGVLAKGAM